MAAAQRSSLDGQLIRFTSAPYPANIRAVTELDQTERKTPTAAGRAG